MTRVLRATCIAAVAIVAVGGVRVAPANGTATPRAAVVVDLGNGQVRTARVRFSGSSITGLAALQRAGFDPQVSSFGGIGGAVCALRVDHAVVGCPTDSSCLLCGAPAYWNYFRATKGATRYSYSPIGAAATTVHDGDVEAWRWGTGSAPHFVSFDTVWTDPPPATTTTTRGRPAASSTTRPAVGAQQLPTTTNAPSLVSSTTTRRDHDDVRPNHDIDSARTRHDDGVRARADDHRCDALVEGREWSAAHVRDDGGGGTDAGTFGAIGLVVALVIAIVAVRWRRRVNTPGAV